jgi:hypothetical protein
MKYGLSTDILEAGQTENSQIVGRTVSQKDKNTGGGCQMEGLTFRQIDK